MKMFMCSIFWEKKILSVTGENELHPENYGQAFDEIRTLAMSYNYPAIWDDWYDMTPRYGEE